MGPGSDCIRSGPRMPPVFLPLRAVSRPFPWTRASALVYSWVNRSSNPRKTPQPRTASGRGDRLLRRLRVAPSFLSLGLGRLLGYTRRSPRPRIKGKGSVFDGGLVVVRPPAPRVVPGSPRSPHTPFIPFRSLCPTLHPRSTRRQRLPFISPLPAPSSRPPATSCAAAPPPLCETRLRAAPAA